uniref:Uncharacterized protein n=1 Tax=Anguilla anguilla TaxID=7936 RepID=A0A0E9S0C4_ANGAN
MHSLCIVISRLMAVCLSSIKSWNEILAL